MVGLAATMGGGDDGGVGGPVGGNKNAFPPAPGSCIGLMRNGASQVSF